MPFYAIRPLTNKPSANRGVATAASPFESASAMKSFVLRILSVAVWFVCRL